MAPHTLSPNRDLNQSELHTLEALVDATSIEAVMQGLSEICGAKAEHIAHNWQDTILAKRLATMEGALGVASTKATGLGGVKFGRKPKLTRHQIHEALARREAGEASLAEIGRTYNVSHSTISRLA